MKSVLQDWVMELPLKQQAMLISALRGPDNLQKGNAGKYLVRYLRNLVLVPANPNWKDDKDDTFFRVEGVSIWLDEFIANHDEYPHHFTMHLIHAFEIVGYKCPKDHPAKVKENYPQNTLITYEPRYLGLHFYCEMAKAFHMTPETEEEMDRRLSI